MKEGLKMKQKSFSSATLLTGVAAFIVFLVAACAAYYTTAGVFVTAQIAAVYAVLGALGALALLFRRKLFALFFYVGCVLGWLSGNFVGGGVRAAARSAFQAAQAAPRSPSPPSRRARRCPPRRNCRSTTGVYLKR